MVHVFRSSETAPELLSRPEQGNQRPGKTDSGFSVKLCFLIKFFHGFNNNFYSENCRFLIVKGLRKILEPHSRTEQFMEREERVVLFSIQIDKE